MLRARETTHFILCVVISPEAEIVDSSFVLHNFDTLRHILVIFGRNEDETHRRAECKRDNSHCLHYAVISPVAEILCRP